MPFLLQNFGPAGGQSKAGAAPSHFVYKTGDGHGVVDNVSYFDEVASVLKVGDIIDVVVVAVVGAVPEIIVTYGSHIVLTNAAGVVNVSNVTPGVVTNT